MKIAFTTNENSINGIVSEIFEESNFLLIVETDNLSTSSYQKSDENGIDYVKIITDNDCEAVITGTIEETAFELLVSACVSRMNGTGYAVKDALVLMEAYKLEYIRDFNGCSGEHLHEHSQGVGGCGAHNHDEE